MPRRCVKVLMVLTMVSAHAAKVIAATATVQQSATLPSLPPPPVPSRHHAALRPLPCYCPPLSPAPPLPPQLMTKHPSADPLPTLWHEAVAAHQHLSYAPLICITELHVLKPYRVMQALAASESAYAHAMTVTSSIPLPGECDGDTMKAALNAFSSLPQVCHASCSQSLSVVHKF